MERHHRKVGSGRFVYEEVRNWGNFPDGWAVEDAPAVAVDSQDRVYVLTRHKDGLVIFDSDGQFQDSWCEDLCVRPHGLFIGPDDIVYIVDDRGHSIYKFTREGELLMTIETRDHPADTGYINNDVNTVVRSGPPFNQPTGVALSPEGDLYVSDGYGNARVHKFSADGDLLFSWGEPGNGPGEFINPHGVWVDEHELVYISDRSNSRIQIFSPQGEYIKEWDDTRYPNNICIDKEGNIYVAEIGCVFLFGTEPILDQPPGRISVRNTDGKILSEWCEEDPLGSGRYFAPHGIAVDSRGHLYVAESTTSYNFGQAPDDWGVVRKYIRI